MTLKSATDLDYFPSTGHQNRLRQKLHGSGCASLEDAECWEYHAYDYAFQRVVLGRNGAVNSPIDPSGEWFDETLVNLAEGFYRRRFKPARHPNNWTAGDEAALQARAAFAGTRVEPARPQGPPAADHVWPAADPHHLSALAEKLERKIAP